MRGKKSPGDLSAISHGVMKEIEREREGERTLEEIFQFFIRSTDISHCSPLNKGSGGQGKIRLCARFIALFGAITPIYRAIVYTVLYTVPRTPPWRKGGRAHKCARDKRFSLFFPPALPLRISTWEEKLRREWRHFFLPRNRTRFRPERGAKPKQTKLARAFTRSLVSTAIFLSSVSINRYSPPSRRPTWPSSPIPLSPPPLYLVLLSSPPPSGFTDRTPKPR